MSYFTLAVELATTVIVAALVAPKVVLLLGCVVVLLSPIALGAVLTAVAIKVIAK